jgi:ribose 5-phosphate isomerase B
MRVVITERDVPLAGDLTIPAGAIVTPLARDIAAARNVRIMEVPALEYRPVAAPDQRVIIGSDHGGFRMKEALRPIIEELRLVVEDIGVATETPVDYPEIAERVAREVLSGKATRGIIIDGAGIGSCIAANKIPGIRAALCYDKASARNGREHNNTNVLTLGGRLLTFTQAEEIVRVWLTTPFAGGRHAGRVEKISDIERRYANWKRPS